jgi:hypothetical protein
VLDDIEAEFASEYVVPDSLLEKLIAEAETGKVVAQPRDMKDPKYSTVAATVVSPPGKKTFLYGEESAISLLDQLQKSCKDHEALSSALSHFRDRVRLALPEGMERR